MSAPESQPILSIPTEAAIFLVLTVHEGSEPDVADVLADVTGVKRSVGFRVPEAELLNQRGIVPTPGEIAHNPRAASGRLRAARKLETGVDH